MNDTGYAPAHGARPMARARVGQPEATGLRLRGAAYWPLGLLEAFTLQMAGHGHSVSVPMMIGDRTYALETLAHAHSLPDQRLHDLTMELFGHFQRQWPTGTRA